MPIVFPDFTLIEHAYSDGYCSWNGKNPYDPDCNPDGYYSWLAGYLDSQEGVDD